MNSKTGIATLCAAAAAIALGGCGEKKASQSGAEATSTASAVGSGGKAADVKPRPGHWQVKLQMTDFEIPGMPDSLKDTVSKQMNQAGDVATCLTKEQVERNDGKMFGPRNRDCTYHNFAMGDGTVAAKMTCSQNGTKQIVEMQGTYGAEAYDLTLKSQGDMGGQQMNMTMHVTGTRTGECSGTEKN